LSDRASGTVRVLLVSILLVVSGVRLVCAQKRDVQTIIEKSVAANNADFNTAPNFNHKEIDHTGKTSKTYQVTMIDGSPYQQLIAVNGKPLPREQMLEEQKKQQQAAAQRRSETDQERRKRIADYQRDRKRDHEMLQQLTKAFHFTYIGQQRLRGFEVYVLKATPLEGYVPPNMETQVLKGMQGQLWIDQKTFHWVKVTARVIHPVAIVGFVARVEPGTEFELEMSPVEDGIWQMAHFSMKSRAKVLLMFEHGSQENDTFFDYRRAAASDQNGSGSSTR
jgi:hypothetical protein